MIGLWAWWGGRQRCSAFLSPICQAELLSWLITCVGDSLSLSNIYLFKSYWEGERDISLLNISYEYNHMTCTLLWLALFITLFSRFIQVVHASVFGFFFVADLYSSRIVMYRSCITSALIWPLDGIVFLVVSCSWSTLFRDIKETENLYWFKDCFHCQSNP